MTGAFLGELARRVLLGVLTSLGKTVPDSLLLADTFSTTNLSEVVLASLPDGPKSPILGCLDQLTGAILSHICILLSERAALMVAVPMATFLNRMAKPTTTIAVTGSLYKHHPTLSKRLDHHTRSMSSHQFAYRCILIEVLILLYRMLVIRLCDDGSGKGAALVAAVLKR